MVFVPHCASLPICVDYFQPRPQEGDTFSVTPLIANASRTFPAPCLPDRSQTQPIYLAKLIFQMPQNKTTKFMEGVIFSLYNYASNRREAYLLLQLLRTALQEEIKYALLTTGVGDREGGAETAAIVV